MIFLVLTKIDPIIMYIFYISVKYLNILIICY